MHPHSKRTLYFFDLPISDISSSVCNALRVMYHGCLDGAFGKQVNERIDLDGIKAVKIRVLHKSSKPLSEAYEYNLVFYRKCIAQSIWDPECRIRQAELKALTRRVSLNVKKSLLAKRIIDHLLIRAEREIYFARYTAVVSPDHYVPEAYHRKLFAEFEPYIMRTRPNYPLVRSLFKAQGLDLAERRLASRESDPVNRVITYKLKSRAASAQASNRLLKIAV
ncbi:MAG TPA: hypothetical protein VIM57_04260 [Luteolibacter sp.]